MGTVSVLFTRSRTLGSLVIRSWQHSPFSHVALIDGGEVIEAVLGEGVRTKYLEHALEDASYHEIKRIPCPRPRDAVDAARSQIGKLYDWKAPIGIGLRQDFHDADRWDCVELVAWAVEQGGRQLFRGNRLHRLKPHDLYLPLFDPALV